MLGSTFRGKIFKKVLANILSCQKILSAGWKFESAIKFAMIEIAIVI